MEKKKKKGVCVQLFKNQFWELNHDLISGQQCAEEAYLALKVSALLVFTLAAVTKKAY